MSDRALIISLGTPILAIVYRTVANFWFPVQDLRWNKFIIESFIYFVVQFLLMYIALSLWERYRDKKRRG